MADASEQWKAVKDWPRYFVSTQGRVKGARGEFLSAKPNNKGYVAILLASGGKPKTKLVHTLVASAFLANPDNKPQVNHINRNRSDNRVENLEWATASENCRNRGPRNGSGGRAVVGKDLNGNILGEWRSVQAAAAASGVTRAAITHCLRGRSKTSAETVWCYRDDTEPAAQGEEWKPCPGRSTHAISSHGRIRTKSGHITCGSLLGPYRIFRGELVHRTVASVFCPKEPGKDVVNHKDGNPENNTAANLEWVTQAENVHHAAALGLIPSRAVRQLFADGTFRDFPSQSAASRATGIHQGNISDICRGRSKSAKGTRWRFLTSEDLSAEAVLPAPLPDSEPSPRPGGLLESAAPAPLSDSELDSLLSELLEDAPLKDAALSAAEMNAYIDSLYAD